MPFSLTAIVGTATYSLTAGTPFRLDSAEGLGMATVRRLTEQTPFGDGDTDLGYRLNSRYVTLSLSYSGSSGSVVDGYRNTLAAIFKPSSTVPVQLRVVRDDGGTRQLDCYTVGQVDVPLEYEYVPGKLERTVVQLKAADPTWYSPTPGTSTVTGTAGLSATWYLAGGAIGTAQVKEYGSLPSNNQAWTYTGNTGNAPGPFDENYGSASIAIRTSKGTAGSAFNTDAMRLAYYGSNNYYIQPYSVIFDVFPTSGLHNLIYSYQNRASAYSQNYIYRDGTVIYSSNDPGGTNLFGGTASRRWRNGWAPDVTLYAAYVPHLTETQVQALNASMSNESGTVIATSLSVPYAGNLPEYPVISLRGPITAPTITNTSTGDVLSFGTIALATDITYTIDLRYGYKRIYDQNGVSRLDKLTSSSNFATFSLQPDPVSSGGTNVITVTGTGTGPATQIKIVYYNRYSEF